MAVNKVEQLRQIPRTILGVTELRRNPQQVFAVAEREGGPILITEFNEPQGVILSLDTFDTLVKWFYRLEIEDALDSVEVYFKEKKAGTLKELRSLADLMDNED